MKLYYTPGVCSLASHIALREAGLDFELERVNPQTKRTDKDADYCQINPNAYVPALQTQQGTVLTEGPAILQYIASQAPSARLAPEHNTEEHYRLLSWLNFITSEIHQTFSPLFNPKMPEEAKTLFREQLTRRFDYVENHLSMQDYLLNSGFSIADAYLFVTTGWAGFLGISLDRWPALVKFRERIASRPAVISAMRAEGLLK